MKRESLNARLGLVAVLAMFLVCAITIGARGNILKDEPIGKMPISAPQPIFDSYGSLPYDSGSAWWNLTQYESGASVYASAYTTKRIIGVQTNLNSKNDWDPNRFSFNGMIRWDDDLSPTGKMNFSQYSSSDEVNLSANVRDQLVNVWAGWDEVNNQPIYTQEMRSYLDLNLNAPAMITSLQGNSGTWTEQAYDSDGNLYYSRSGGEFSFWGNGEYIAVPEPASLSLLAIASLGLVSRRRRSH